jgi:hypothetical protein
MHVSVKYSRILWNSIHNRIIWKSLRICCLVLSRNKLWIDILSEFRSIELILRNGLGEGGIIACGYFPWHFLNLILTANYLNMLNFKFNNNTNTIFNIILSNQKIIGYRNLKDSKFSIHIIFFLRKSKLRLRS